MLWTQKLLQFFFTLGLCLRAHLENGIWNTFARKELIKKPHTDQHQKSYKPILKFHELKNDYSLGLIKKVSTDALNICFLLSNLTLPRRCLHFLWGVHPNARIIRFPYILLRSLNGFRRKLFAIQLSQHLCYRDWFRGVHDYSSTARGSFQLYQ